MNVVQILLYVVMTVEEVIEFVHSQIYYFAFWL